MLSRWCQAIAKMAGGLLACQIGDVKNKTKTFTLWQTNIAMEEGPFEDVFPIKNG